ncbi:hypothetical protein XENOCAPTIV_009815 [Xenoophorus captivus]|uniref:Uncharacterized protein n=1 Tax=Xenoophorus captivus TaxID=1517983 RepID=A0ABV0RRJ4_9TELE
MFTFLGLFRFHLRKRLCSIFILRAHFYVYRWSFFSVHLSKMCFKVRLRTENWTRLWPQRHETYRDFFLAANVSPQQENYFNLRDVGRNNMVPYTPDPECHKFGSNVNLSTQPIASLDWSPDKQGLCLCSGFDQSVRVLIVTKLNVA